MSKRRKFLVSAAAVAGFFWLLQYVPLDYRALMVGGLALFTYGAAALSLREDLRGVEWLTLLILPVMYSLAAGFFYYLLPNHFLSRLVVSLVFLVGLYAILLTENIYSVAAVRTIQLVRAAHAVGFLMTVLTTVLLFNVLYSFHWPVYVNGITALIIGIPIYLQSLWAVKLEARLTRGLWGMSLALAWLLAHIAMALSLVPVTVWAASLFTGTVVYVVVGLLQQALQERLFERTVWEYLGVGLIVLVATLLITPWK